MQLESVPTRSLARNWCDLRSWSEMTPAEREAEFAWQCERLSGRYEAWLDAERNRVREWA